MISLDANVISELWKPHPDERVRAWWRARQSGELAVTAIVVSEIVWGIERLPAGRRRSSLTQAWGKVLDHMSEPVVAFNESAARQYGRLVAEAERNGFVVGRADGEIAACAVLHGMSVATRDTAPFVAMGVPVLDPWKD